MCAAAATTGQKNKNKHKWGRVLVFNQNQHNSYRLTVVHQSGRVVFHMTCYGGQAVLPGPPRCQWGVTGSVAPPDLRCAANDARGGSSSPRLPCILELLFPWCFGGGGQHACRISYSAGTLPSLRVLTRCVLFGQGTGVACTKHPYLNCGRQQTQVRVFCAGETPIPEFVAASFQV